jgi:rubrerythrin
MPAWHVVRSQGSERRDDMTIHTATTFDPIKMLRSLAELDYDMVQAYETAIDRLDDVAMKKGMRVCVDDHRRHIVDLNLQIVDLGGKPWVEDDFRHVLEQGKVFLASVVGDRGVLKAMLSNEEESNQAYARAAAIRGLAPQISRLLDTNLDDERRHRSWIGQALYSLEQ